MLILTMQYYLLSFFYFLMLRLFSFRLILRWMSLQTGECRFSTATDASFHARRLRRIVKRINRFGWWRFKCLEQSLLIMHYCKRNRLGATLYLGALKSSGKLNAHAWVLMEKDYAFNRHSQRSYSVVGTYYTAPCCL